MTLELKVINLFAAPGVGKSTTAAGLFNLMKQMGLSVEYVSEFAKDLTWERNQTALQNQLLILGEQDHRLRRLEGKVEWAITDSPLPLGIAYHTPEYAELELDVVTLNAFWRYDNYDFLLNRVKPYRAEGRNQTEFQALQLDATVMSVFRRATGWSHEVPNDEEAQYWQLDADEWAPYAVAGHLPLPTSLEKFLAA